MRIVLAFCFLHATLNWIVSACANDVFRAPKSKRYSVHVLPPFMTNVSWKKSVSLYGGDTRKTKQHDDKIAPLFCAKVT